MKDFKVVPTLREPISISTDSFYILGEIGDIDVKYESGDRIEKATEVKLVVTIKNIRRIVADEGIDDESNVKILKFK